MKEFVDHLVKVERALAEKKGAVNLFALFLREDAPDKWDLLIAAPWAERNKPDTLKYIAQKLQKSLSKKELLKLSHIVIIDHDNPALDAFQKAFHVEHGSAEIQNSNLFGLQIKHAYLITSRRSGEPAPNKALQPTSPASGGAGS
jgi:hypothetical protein